MTVRIRDKGRNLYALHRPVSLSGMISETCICTSPDLAPVLDNFIARIQEPDNRLDVYNRKLAWASKKLRERYHAYVKSRKNPTIYAQVVVKYILKFRVEIIEDAYRGHGDSSVFNFFPCVKGCGMRVGLGQLEFYKPTDEGCLAVNKSKITEELGTKIQDLIVNHLEEQHKAAQEKSAERAEKMVIMKKELQEIVRRGELYIKELRQHCEDLEEIIYWWEIDRNEIGSNDLGSRGWGTVQKGKWRGINVAKFPGDLLPSTYCNPDDVNDIRARSELERRGEYVDTLASFVELVKQVISAPRERPNTGELLARLHRMKVEVEGEYGSPVRLDMVRVRLAKEVKVKDRRIVELTQQQVTQGAELQEKAREVEALQVLQAEKLAHIEQLRNENQHTIQTLEHTIQTLESQTQCQQHTIQTLTQHQQNTMESQQNTIQTLESQMQDLQLREIIQSKDSEIRRLREELRKAAKVDRVYVQPRWDHSAIAVNLSPRPTIYDSLSDVESLANTTVLRFVDVLLLLLQAMVNCIVALLWGKCGWFILFRKHGRAKPCVDLWAVAIFREICLEPDLCTLVICKCTRPLGHSVAGSSMQGDPPQGVKCCCQLYSTSHSSCVQVTPELV